MRHVLALLCLLVALLAAACGGGQKEEAKDETAAPATTEATQETVAPTKEAKVTKAPTKGANKTPTVSPRRSPTPGASVGDIFPGLDSYRYSMEISAGEGMEFKIEGAFEAPDKVSMDMYLSGSDQPLGSSIIIGDRTWEKQLFSDQWSEITPGEEENSMQGFTPDAFWSEFPAGELVAVSDDLGKEKVNGVNANHYQLSAADAQTLLKLSALFGEGDTGEMPESFNMELWLAQDGDWPVKASIGVAFPSGSQTTNAQINWEVADINDPAISIEPPM
jgi:hypothetical protein